MIQDTGDIVRGELVAKYFLGLMTKIARRIGSNLEYLQHSAIKLIYKSTT